MVILKPTVGEDHDHLGTNLFAEDWALSVATKILAEIYGAVGDGPFGSIWLLSRLEHLEQSIQ